MLMIDWCLKIRLSNNSGNYWWRWRYSIYLEGLFLIQQSHIIYKTTTRHFSAWTRIFDILPPCSSCAEFTCSNHFVVIESISLLFSWSWSSISASKSMCLFPLVKWKTERKLRSANYRCMNFKSPLTSTFRIFSTYSFSGIFWNILNVCCVSLTAILRPLHTCVVWCISDCRKYTIFSTYFLLHTLIVFVLCSV